MTEKAEQNFKSHECNAPTDSPGAGSRNCCAWRPRVTISCYDVVVRIGLLFLVLILVKLMMLVGFRKHLFEIHWRIAGQPFTWINEIAFYGFAALVGLNLWMFGRRCRDLSAGAVRRANACVVILSAIFILLTFHEGDKNYLSPILNQILTVKDLGSYMSLNFFFRPPYLSVWLLIYSATYYMLVRKQREHWVLMMTAVFTVAYILLCLRDLNIHRDALVVADCVGLACLLFSVKGKQPPGWLPIFLLILCGASFFLLFHSFAFRLSFSGVLPEFAILSFGSLVLFAGVTLLLGRWNLWSVWSGILPFFLVSFLLLITGNFFLADNYSNLLCLGFTLPRYFFGEFLLCASLFACAVFYRNARPTGSLWWLDVINVLLIAVALLDFRLARIMEVRLDWPALSLAMGETPRMMWRMARPYLPAILGALLVLGVIYFAVIRLFRRISGGRGSLSSESKFSATFAVMVFLFLGLAGTVFIQPDKALSESAILLVKTSPLWKGAISPPMDRDAFVENARQLGMKQLLAPRVQATTGAVRDLNVVLIFQESTYNKYLSLFSGTDETQPLVSKYKDRMELFPNFFSSFAGSINARFAAFTGLYPVSDYKAFTATPVPVDDIFSVLHCQNYACSMFYSSSFDYTGFRDFLRGRNIDGLYDADSMPGKRTLPPVSWGLREEETLGAIKTQIKNYAATKQKFFLTYIPAAPHNPYDGTPKEFQKYQLKEMGDFTPLYKNELLYMDSIIASILDQLKASGVLDKTLVVITSDHGELLGNDKGPIGHGWMLTPELANVPLIIMDPENLGYRINQTIGSQVDLLPTILNRLNVPLSPRQLYQGDSLYSDAASEKRQIYLNTFQHFGIIEGKNLLISDRQTQVTSNGLASTFAISNEGARTIFSSTNAFHAPSISLFDRFQTAFLRDYADYCRMMQTEDVKP